LSDEFISFVEEAMDGCGGLGGGGFSRCCCVNGGSLSVPCHCGGYWESVRLECQTGGIAGEKNAT